MLTVGRARLRMAQLDKAIAIAQDAFAMLKKIPSSTQKICDDKDGCQTVLMLSFVCFVGFNQITFTSS